MSDYNTTHTPYVIPKLQGLYATLAPLTVLYMRVIAGAAFMVHGWPKILDPMARIGMVEGLGFHPGWFWAPLLAATEFFGGLMLVLGLLTRPAAFACSIVLCVTTWFHWVVQAEGFGGAETSLLWLSITLYFVAHGGGRFSVDRAIGRQF
ncbi:DoxX family protein [Paracoccus benzoatiresistens]|uniref:DoxX family protein n=1 Tax=Paracoccus benzoatiresistens TaxID=2997341 RepID=A0ABT4J0F6_9RHOB|nr:DoxX family protein [Paracoccus sp. EF6]MCZ0960600.1 DoxX family protein [Paracoccus sp. EF6]